MGKVKLNKDNKINEGIMGDDDFVVITPNRGFSDRSAGDEFFRTGRNTGSNIIETPDMFDDEEDFSDDEYEDMGYDYDGGDDEMDDDDDDAGYSYHPELRTQLYKIDSRLTSLETMLTDLFGSNGTPTRPIQ